MGFTKINVYSKKITSANILKVSVGTTGYCGGDSGHGGKTYFALEDLGSTDITIHKHPGRVEIIFGGDSELGTFIEALAFASKILKQQIELDPDVVETREFL